MTPELKAALDKADYLAAKHASDGYWLLESHQHLVTLAAEVRRLQEELAKFNAAEVAEGEKK